MEIEITVWQSRNNQIPRNSTLPQEMIEEILLRLPVKSLWRFRLVSKSWRSLISSKRFIEEHLQYSTRDASLAHHRVLLASHHATLSYCSLLSLFNKPDVHPLEIDFPINAPLNSKGFNFPTNARIHSISLVGCSNGLVCVLLNSKHFILWNPSTRISKNLPPTHDTMKIMRFGGTGTACYGFCYDESSDDYKVFWFASLNKGSGCKLYSLKSGSWKRMNVWDISLRCRGQGKLASGKLHWLGTHSQLGHYRSSDDSNDKREIIAFDMSTETYGTVEQPGYSEAGFWPFLGKIGECLSLVCYYNTCIHVWVMKDYGVRESWEKVTDVFHFDHWKPLSLSPFCIGPEGEIVLMHEGIFLIYYKDNWFRRVGAGEGNLNMVYEADIYVESLVSPFSDDERVRCERYARRRKAKMRKRKTRGVG